MPAQLTDRLAIDRAGAVHRVTVAELIALTAAGSVVAGRTRRSTNQSIPVGASFTLVSFDTAAMAVGGTFYSGATPTEAIIPEDGVYQIDFEGTGEGAAVIVTWEIQVSILGGAVLGGDQFMAPASATAPLSNGTTQQFTAGQRITVGIKHSNATALNLLTEATHSPAIRIVKVGGASGAADTRAPQLLSDFTHTNAVQNDFTIAIIGTASSFTTTPAAARLTPNHPGVHLWRSGTTANSGVQCLTALGLFRIGGGERWDVNFATCPVLTTVTFRSGALDSATVTAPVDGVYFEMTLSGVIVGKCRSNSVESVTATLATLTASTDYHGKIEVNAAGTSVQFTVYSDAGAVLGTAALTTNIPTASGREFGWGSIATSSGTVAIDVLNIDRQMLTNPGRILARGSN